MWGFLLNSFLLNLTPSSTRPPEVNIDGENLHRFLNDSRNFNKIVRKDVTYDNIVTKKHGFIVCLEDAFLKKPQGSQIDPTPVV